MARRKKNLWKKTFGTRFNIWDFIIIGILIYYIYGVYQGINTPTWRVFELFAGTLFFILVLKQWREFILRKK